MKILIAKKSTNRGAIILEAVDIDVPPGVVNNYGRMNTSMFSLGALRNGSGPFRHYIRGSRELRDFLNEITPPSTTPTD